MLTEVGQTFERLGISRNMIDFVDPASLIRMSDPGVVLVIGRMLEEESEAREALGDARAELVRARARFLIDAAESAGGTLPLDAPSP